MKLRAEIFSYWTFDTDLAKAMGRWKEFVSGSGYSVDLRAASTGEAVAVRLIEKDGDRWLAISSTSTGELFERALGRVALEMAKNSEIHVHAVDKDA